VLKYGERLPPRQGESSKFSRRKKLTLARMLSHQFATRAVKFTLIIRSARQQGMVGFFP
jgi:hypothetical protein